MKIILALTLLFLSMSGQVSAQTPVSKEQANAYYKNCNAKQDPRMSQKSQNALCACTSFMMTQHMSVEDIKIMSGNTQESRLKLNKMLLDVYAPCMNYPLEDLVRTECLNNKKIEGLGIKKTKKEICSCMAKKTADWFVKEGRPLMSKIIAKNPNIYDPIGPVMESKAFKSQSYNSMIACLNKGT